MPTAWEMGQMIPQMDANNLNPFGINANGIQNWTQFAQAPVNTALDPSANGYNSNINGSAPSWQNWSTPAPQYQGLNNGDYTQLQQNLTTPGQIQADRAYQSGKTALQDQMTGNGLYGSSFDANQLNQNLTKNYADTLASNSANAAAQTTQLKNQNQQFGQQQAMLGWQSGLGQSMAQNQYNQGMFGQMSANNNNAWNQGLQNASWNAYQNNLQPNYENQLAQANQQYQTGQYGINQQQRQNALGLIQNLYTGTDPQYANMRQAQTDAAYNQQQGAGMGGILGGAGGLFGGIGSLVSSMGSSGAGAGAAAAGVGAAAAC